MTPGTPWKSSIRPTSLSVPEDEDSLFFCLIFSPDGTYSCEKGFPSGASFTDEPRWSTNNFSSLEPLFSSVNSRDNKERETERQWERNNDLVRPHAL